MVVDAAVAAQRTLVLFGHNQRVQTPQQERKPTTWPSSCDLLYRHQEGSRTLTQRMDVPRRLSAHLWNPVVSSQTPTHGFLIGRTGMVHGPINLVGHTGAVYATVFTPDGRRLVSGSGDTTIKIWDVERATEEATLDAGLMGVFSLAITRDGLLLAAAGFADRTVKLWSLASSSERFTDTPKF
jgi:WD40 repeat protein